MQISIHLHTSNIRTSPQFTVTAPLCLPLTTFSVWAFYLCHCLALANISGRSLQPRNLPSPNKHIYAHTGTQKQTVGSCQPAVWRPHIQATYYYRLLYTVSGKCHFDNFTFAAVVVVTVVVDDVVISVHDDNDNYNSVSVWMPDVGTRTSKRGINGTKSQPANEGIDVCADFALAGKLCRNCATSIEVIYLCLLKWIGVYLYKYMSL